MSEREELTQPLVASTTGDVEEIVATGDRSNGSRRVRFNLFGGGGGNRAAVVSQCEWK